MTPTIAAVCSDAEHNFSKPTRESIVLLSGIGVEGDAHSGRMVQHVSRAAREPELPNLRQVHLIHAELHDELRAAGFDVGPGQMGENITTRGIDLLALPRGTRLHLGATAIVEVTGLRTPCSQLDRLHPGLMAATIAHDDQGNMIRKAGIMSIVISGGTVRAGDTIQVELPPRPHEPLGPV